jgi:hypothetical protein
MDDLSVPLLDDSCNLPLDVPFTAAVARAAGVPKRLLALWCQLGLLRQPIRRVYVAAQAPDSLVLRAQCLALVAPQDAVICDRHAGWLHGAEMVLAPNEHLNVLPVAMYLPTGRRLRNALSESGERRLRPDDITEIMGLPVTTTLRTAWDLGRVRSRERAISALDQMLRLPKFDVDAFLAGVERFRGERWVTTLRTVAPLADGRAESPPESILRLYWIDAGLPWPIPQLEVWVDGSLIARLDVGHPAIWYAAEYDGVEWHSSPEQRRHDRARRHAVRDEGFSVEVFKRNNVFGQRRDVEARLSAAAVQANRSGRVYLRSPPTRRYRTPVTTGRLSGRPARGGRRRRR